MTSHHNPSLAHITHDIWYVKQALVRFGYRASSLLACGREVLRRVPGLTCGEGRRLPCVRKCM